MLFGCVHIPNFSCQAAVRVDPLLGDKAVAVIDGSSPLVRVIAINATARKLGLELGMTKTEAESCPGLLIRERSLALKPPPTPRSSIVSHVFLRAAWT
jgi:protein ImuB